MKYQHQLNFSNSTNITVLALFIPPLPLLASQTSLKTLLYLIWAPYWLSPHFPEYKIKHYGLCPISTCTELVTNWKNLNLQLPTLCELAFLLFSFFLWILALPSFLHNHINPPWQYVPQYNYFNTNNFPNARLFLSSVFSIHLCLLFILFLKYNFLYPLNTTWTPVPSYINICPVLLATLRQYRMNSSIFLPSMNSSNDLNYHILTRTKCTTHKSEGVFPSQRDWCLMRIFSLLSEKNCETFTFPSFSKVYPLSLPFNRWKRQKIMRSPHCDNWQTTSHT